MRNDLADGKDGEGEGEGESEMTGWQEWPTIRMTLSIADGIDTCKIEKITKLSRFILYNSLVIQSLKRHPSAVPDAPNGCD